MGGGVGWGLRLTVWGATPEGWTKLGKPAGQKVGFGRASFVWLLTGNQRKTEKRCFGGSDS